MKTLHLDIETYSSVSIQKVGVYRYTEAEDFEILLVGYSVDGGPVQVVSLAQGETLPQYIIEALADDSVTKWAFHAAFERICFSRLLGLPTRQYLNPKSWRCTMVWAAYVGLPLSLEGVGTVLGLEQQKLAAGKDLIRFFCQPCASAVQNGRHTRNLPADAPEKWQAFKEYNIRDVQVEMSIQNSLKHFPMPDFLRDEYLLDQQINDRGIALDMAVVENALAFDAKSKAELAEKMQELTDLNNPNSVVQMKQWLSDNGLELDGLGKKEVAQAIERAPQPLAEVLQLWQQLAKSSLKKYQAMQNAVCADGRARGMFQFYGANRTGRWAGRIIQLQNLPQNRLSDLAEARELVCCGDYEQFQARYADVPDTLSQLIRTAFVPSAGMQFVVADFAAIEARVLSHLAKEDWRNEVFANDGDIYCASAAAMFGVPVEKHGVNHALRQKGKIAELALGYGGAVGALQAMGALEMGLSEGELQPLVDSWRAANPNIVRLWQAVDRCVKYVIRNRAKTATHGIQFCYRSGALLIRLPSGRQLCYVRPRIEKNRFGGSTVSYEGIGVTKKWERIQSYGAKFVENIVQAISRDILAYAMQTLSHSRICGHIHDELIIECDAGLSLEAVCKQMSRPPPWMPELMLRADGYQTAYYRKE